MKSLCIYDRAKDIEDKIQVINLIKIIEKFIFITFGLCSYRTTYRKNQIYQNAKDLDSIKDIENIVKDLEKIMITGYPKETEGTYYQNTLHLDNFKKYNNFKGNFYKWSWTQYLLYEYEYSLHTNNTTTFKGMTYTIKEEKSWIHKEHIAPQTITQDWKDAFNFNNIDGKTYDKQINCIGNILLLNKLDNPKLGNKNFEAKKELYSEDSKSSDKVAKKASWSFDTIVERGVEILNFANKRWELNLSPEVIKSIADGGFFD